MLRITHIGGPTALIEVGGWRLLTDPTFDPAGGRYRFGWGTGSEKLGRPGDRGRGLGAIDAVLLTHDHHDDNLDKAGRELLPSPSVVVTTEPGAKRLGGGARGLAPGRRRGSRLTAKPPIEVTATPCRHGPPLSRPIVGDVIGFALAWEGQEHGVLWISGDTVLYRACSRSPTGSTSTRRCCTSAGCAFRHRPVALHDDRRGSGRALRPGAAATAIPIHYEGWKHFREGRERSSASLRQRRRTSAIACAGYRSASRSSWPSRGSRPRRGGRSGS